MLPLADGLLTAIGINQGYRKILPQLLEVKDPAGNLFHPDLLQPFLCKNLYLRIQGGFSGSPVAVNQAVAFSFLQGHTAYISAPVLCLQKVSSIPFFINLQLGRIAPGIFQHILAGLWGSIRKCYCLPVREGIRRPKGSFLRLCDLKLRFCLYSGLRIILPDVCLCVVQSQGIAAGADAQAFPFRRQVNHLAVLLQPAVNRFSLRGASGQQSYRRFIHGYVCPAPPAYGIAAAIPIDHLQADSVLLDAYQSVPDLIHSVLGFDAGHLQGSHGRGLPEMHLTASGATFCQTGVLHLKHIGDARLQIAGKNSIDPLIPAA